jgi:TolB-like protein/DNA-binding winged helix-turn-helix (wHTH) protein/cytochrome c-type biogenesis protein CcmH/NrfG
MNFHVADWYVDVDSNRIQSGQQDIKLESRVMTLLVYLAKNQGTVVSREQLEADVWSGRVISYDALTSCITRLRKVLGDDSRKPVYIETVPKKGYRLIAPVSWNSSVNHGEGDAKETGSKPALPVMLVIAAALLLLVAVAAIVLVPSQTNISDDPAILSQAPSIIVLPFENLSNDDDQDYFSNGITADISIALSKLSGLRVIAPQSLLVESGEYDDANKLESQQLARYLLAGSVQRAANKLRVNVMLVDNDTHHQLWAESYNREITDVFDVQDEITASIVSTLEIKLTEEEKSRVAHRFTNSIEAYDQFLRAQALYTQRSNNENLLARDHLQRAIQLDPNFARAYSTLALTYVDEYRYRWSSSTEDPLLQTLKLAEKAVAIDNDLPQAYWSLAYAQLHLRRYEQAIESINRSLQVRPSYADGYAILALIYIYGGDAEQGMKMIRQAMRLNPDYPARYISVLGQAYYYQDDFENAAAVFRDAVDKNFSLLTAHIMLTATLSQLGQQDEASWSAGQLRTISPGFTMSDAARIFPIENEEKLQAIFEQLRLAGLD